MSIQSVGNALSHIVYDLASVGDDNYLRDHPGNGFDALRTAFGRLSRHQAMARFSDNEFSKVFEALESSYRTAQELCESPIERTMLAALMAGNWDFLSGAFLSVSSSSVKGKVYPDAVALLIPQFQVLSYRLDFALVIKHQFGKKIFAIECDGKEFHDAAADHKRDQNLKALGIDAIRFTGSELAADAARCADHVIAQARVFALL